MAREIRSTPLRYGLALSSFGLALLVILGLPRITSVRIDLTTLIIFVMIGSAWYLGRGPGLLIAFLFELTLDYFSTAPFTGKTLFFVFNRLVLFVSIVLFASSRRKAEKRLTEQGELLQVTLSSIGDAVIATDIAGTVTFINPTAAALTGWQAQEANGKPFNEVFRVVNEDTGEPVDSPFAIVEREQSVVGLANHTVLITRDGRQIPIEDSGAPIKDSDGKMVGVIVVFHDTSERRRTEQERESLLRSEQAARKEAEAADRLKDEFLATVSHELRTPLSAILGWSAMLNLGEVDEETRSNALKVIERNARSQASIIDDILDVSRIITGKLNIEQRNVDLAPIIHTTVDSLHPAATAKGIKLTVTLEKTPGLVTGDPARLQQIVWNLVSNAIKFTSKDGRITVRLSPINSHLQFSVSDTGMGISEEFLPHVFERFRQADSSTTRAHGGLGLGLAIVRHLVELHGGTVGAESDGTGKGSMFKVRLPVATATDLPFEPSALNPVKTSDDGDGARPHQFDLRGLRVLVVDDELDTLEIVSLLLRRYGATVRTSISSADAFQVFNDWKPNVLISDLGMPGEDGYSFISKVRSLPPEAGGETPALALTAYVREEDRLQTLAAGYEMHVKKPVEPFKLAEAVARLGKRSSKN
ncbi:MAG TPA: ATP-binding protein [Pyrinomonadaceae bacterium]|nr:ATP-binding protein [Pyrinomonadaceae bacterium]